MEIFINESTRLSEIQKQFSDRFPYLKIEFFKIPHLPNEGSSRELMLTSDKKVGDVRNKGARGRINISGMMTVKELEQKFQNLFGINVQVFRKAGKNWIQTTVTDDWTLTEQNLKAEEMCDRV